MKLKQVQRNQFSIVGQQNHFRKAIDGKRAIVMRSCIKSLELINPEKPTQYEPGVETFVSSTNAMAVRMFTPEGNNDSYTISKSFQKRLDARKTVIQTIKVPKDAVISWMIDASTDIENDILLHYQNTTNRGKIEDNSIASHLLRKMDMPDIIAMYFKREAKLKCIVRPGQIIGKVSHKYKNGEARSYVVRSRVKLGYGAIVTGLTEDPTNDDMIRCYTITYQAIVRAEIGDKLMNQTGHKGTIGRIIEDEEMPKVNGTPVDIIIPFELGKRCTPASIIEEVASLYVRENGEEVFQQLDSECSSYRQLYDEMIKEGVKYPGILDSNGEPVGYGYLRFYRIDNIPSEILKYSIRNVDDRKFIRKNGIKLSYPIVLSVLTRGANDLFKWMVNLPRRNQEVTNHHDIIRRCIRGEVSDHTVIDICRYLPSQFADVSPSLVGMYGLFKSEEYDNTVLDSRLSGFTIGEINTYSSNGEPRKLYIPPIIAEEYVTDGNVIVVKECTKVANTIIMLTRMYEKTVHKNVYLSKIDIYVNKYQAILGEMIAIIAGELSNPITGNSIYATATGDNSLGVNEVGVPEHIYHKFMKANESFKRSEDKRVLVFRQPVHTEIELVSMKAVPRKGNTIRVNPMVIGLFRGDFDGDAIYVLVPDEEKAYHDLSKLTVEEVMNKNDNWKMKGLCKSFMDKMEVSMEDKDMDQMKDWEIEYALLNSEEFYGLSSWPGFMDMENVNPNWKELFDVPITEEFLNRNAAESCWNMSNIKTQTALSGGAALTFIGWLLFSNENVEDISYGLDFYRFIAEDSLKGNKSGVGGKMSRGLIKHYQAARKYEGVPADIDRKAVYACIDELITNDGANPENFPRMKELFYEFLRSKSEYESLDRFTLSISPIFGIVRKSMTRKAVEGYLAQDNMTIFDHRL